MMSSMLLSLVLTASAARGIVEQESTTSSREKMVFAATAISEMRDVHAELEVMERASDGDRSICLVKKVAHVGELIDASETASNRIPDALAEGADEAAELEFKKVTVALGRARQVRDEASVCGYEIIQEGPALPEALAAGWSGAQAGD